MRAAALSADAGAVSARVVELFASLDAEELWRGGSTRLRIEVIGTDQPLDIELVNATPNVVRLGRGDRLRGSTSGGRRNRLEETVHAVARGEFSIDWNVALGGCPCDGESASP